MNLKVNRRSAVALVDGVIRDSRLLVEAVIRLFTANRGDVSLCMEED